MSWVVEEWKEGLSTRALQKIQELESQLDKLKKERQQRQFQLESLEAALQKQKQKVIVLMHHVTSNAFLFCSSLPSMVSLEQPLALLEAIP
uniref:Centromere protein Cenp-F N-terminal domain-containing protein n=1 Tax=Chelonoidis abingdonii TaxID=106734 RepID=A0A8C0GRD2_CHEAB